MTQPRVWFISHPSGGKQHTPIFFQAVEESMGRFKDVSFVVPESKPEDEHLTKQIIEKADLVLVEVSLPSTGSGIELGWANAAGKPIIAFRNSGSTASPALQFVTTEMVEYVSLGDILAVFERLHEQGI